MTTEPIKNLETFENPQPGRNYTIRIETPEFTCLCPKTGQPDLVVIDCPYLTDSTIGWADDSVWFLADWTCVGFKRSCKKGVKMAVGGRVRIYGLIHIDLIVFNY